MSDNWDDEPVLHMATGAEYDKEDIGIEDVVDDWDASEPEEVEVKPEPIKQVVVETAPKKKTPKQLAREKEEADRKKRALELYQKGLEEEAKRKERSDPNYAANKKERERLAILESEKELARDLFGDFIISSPAAKKVDNDVQEEDVKLAATAARLANATGLADGADGMAAINDPNARTVQAAASPLDTVDLSTKTNVYDFSKKFGEKLVDLNTKDGIVEAFKGLIASASPAMKVEELTEVIRVLNVAKTEANKNLQGKKKKKANSKPTLKAGSAYDDFGGFDDYDDYSYDRNGADPDFF